MIKNYSNIVIIGLGETGYASARYFIARNMPVVIVDSRNDPPKLAEFKQQYPQVPVYTGGFKKEILVSADLVILSPGISKDHSDIRHNVSPGVEIIGDIEYFARCIDPQIPIVAITGSNGKSTVTTLVYEMAKAAGIQVAVGGNLGIPVLSLLSEKFDLLVLELSSFQLETTSSLKLKTATVLNVSPDHMDRYSSLVDYKAAKCRIFEHCEQMVINREDPVFSEAINHKTKIISFGLGSALGNNFGIETVNHQKWLAKGRTPLMPIAELKLFGLHNIANALAALAIGASIDLPLSVMLTVLKSFKGLAHRCEWIKEIHGVPWINDSKGTNVGATIAALEGIATAIPGKWVLIAGGVGKGADFSPLREVIAAHCRAVVLIGEAKEALKHLLEPAVPCLLATTMGDAVLKCSKLAEPGDGVLLSPACASLDMFSNFEARGEAFREAVLNFKG